MLSLSFALVVYSYSLLRDISEIAQTYVTDPLEAPTIDVISEAEGDWLMKATCYVETGYNMANGEYPYWGAVAVKQGDARLSIGDTIYIEEFNRSFDVKDTLPSYQQADIDIYWGTDREDCLQYGMRNVHVRKL